MHPLGEHLPAHAGVLHPVLYEVLLRPFHSRHIKKQRRSFEGASCPLSCIGIYTEKIQFFSYQVHLPCLYFGPKQGNFFPQLLRVLPLKEGIEKEAVQKLVGQIRSPSVSCLIRLRIHGHEVEGNTHSCLRIDPAKALHRLAVGNKLIVGRAKGRPIALFPRCMNSQEVPENRIYPRFVQGYPVFHPVSQAAYQKFGVIGKTVANLRGGETSKAVLKVLWKIPVKHGYPGAYVVFEKRIDEPGVEIHPLFVYPSVALRNKPGPRYGKPVCIHTEGVHYLYIFIELVVVVAGYISVVPRFYLSRCVAKRIPHRGPPPSLVYRSFYLVGGCCGAEYKVLWKLRLFFHCVLLFNILL